MRKPMLYKKNVKSSIINAISLVSRNIKAEIHFVTARYILSKSKKQRNHERNTDFIDNRIYGTRGKT
jgi:hypothetical protein